jgi:hypothetical protein
MKTTLHLLTSVLRKSAKIFGSRQGEDDCFHQR